MGNSTLQMSFGLPAPAGEVPTPTALHSVAQGQRQVAAAKRHPGCEGKGNRREPQRGSITRGASCTPLACDDNQMRARTQGALRDPGLWNGTPSVYTAGCPITPHLRSLPQRPVPVLAPIASRPPASPASAQDNAQVGHAMAPFCPLGCQRNLLGAVLPLPCR